LANKNLFGTEIALTILKIEYADKAKLRAIGGRLSQAYLIGRAHCSRNGAGGESHGSHWDSRVAKAKTGFKPVAQLNPRVFYLTRSERMRKK